MTAVERTTVSPDLPAPVRVLLDHVTDGVVLLDAGGRPLFLNEAARHLLGVEPAGTGGEQGVLDRALALGGRVVSLPGPGAVADAVVIPAPEVGTLAERERSAILRALEATHGRLAETARRLGISRTTLWRRLKAYGLEGAAGDRWRR